MTNGMPIESLSARRIHAGLFQDFLSMQESAHLDRLLTVSRRGRLLIIEPLIMVSGLRLSRSQKVSSQTLCVLKHLIVYTLSSL